jgi:hypothetical protein
MRQFPLVLFAVLLLAPAAFAQQDTTPPALVQLDFSPKTIDVGVSDAVVNCTVQVSDDLSGFLSGFVRFNGPSVSHQCSFGASNLISGDRFDGVYQGVVTIPQFSPQGTWEVGAVVLIDEVNNSINLSTPDLAAMGFPTQLEVVSDSDGDGVPDNLDDCNETRPEQVVDEFGCSIDQFCGLFDASTNIGARECRFSDWLDDHPVRGNPKDCRAVRAEIGRICIAR